MEKIDLDSLVQKYAADEASVKEVLEKIITESDFTAAFVSFIEDKSLEVYGGFKSGSFYHEFTFSPYVYERPEILILFSDLVKEQIVSEQYEVSVKAEKQNTRSSDRIVRVTIEIQQKIGEL